MVAVGVAPRHSRRQQKIKEAEAAQGGSDFCVTSGKSKSAGERGEVVAAVAAVPVKCLRSLKRDRGGVGVAADL